MSGNAIERRDLVTAGLAAGALAATTGATTAEAASPARLTLHVLDVESGRPAGNLHVDLSALDGQTHRLIKTVTTAASGRPDQPLLEGDALKVGEYELLLHVAEYYSALGVKLANPPFLNRIPIRFSVAEAAAYHIPVLLTPWSYSTYRGS